MKFRRRTAITLASVTSFLILLPVTAQAASQSLSGTFNPNAPATTTFDPPPTLPLIPFSFSYDSVAGTLTFIEGGCDSNYNDATFYLYDCQEDAFTVSGPTSEVQSTNNVAPGGGSITVLHVGGSLDPQMTFDGSTVTDVYSSPLLRGLDLDYATIYRSDEAGVGFDNQCGCDEFPDIEQYFPGDLPQITLTAVKNQTSSYDSFGNVRAPIAQVTGVARADPSYPASPKIKYSGLPPGISPDPSANGALDGDLSTSGTYHVRATASAQVNAGETISATTPFTWVLKPAPPSDYLAAPYLGASASELEYKPADITYTGDGTGQLAGAHHKGRRFSRLRWTSWTTSAANAVGDDWEDNCDPDCASGRFTGYPVEVRLSRPEKLSAGIVFTRLRWTYKRTRPHYQHYRSPRTIVDRVTYTDGSFSF